jgi:hypothetical protein
MQSRNPNQFQGVWSILGVIGMLGIFLWGLIAFAALIFGALCVAAFFRGGLSLGKWELSYETALGFMGFSAAGIIGLPLFLNITAWMMGTRVTPGSLGMETVIIGYTIGAIGWVVWQIKRDEQQAQSITPVLPHEREAQRAPPQSVSRVHEFASWDDEELRR